MSGFPLIVDGAQLSALIVGGGPVAARKAAALLECGATVRVVSPAVNAELLALRLPDALVERKRYATGDIRDEVLVIAATDSREVNALVAADARALRRLVLVANDAAEGNCAMPAAHRTGELLIAVSAGGVPAVASRIRDAIGERFDVRYSDAIATLQAMRRHALRGGDATGWRRSAAILVNENFCEAVESGAFSASVRR